jgi:hypothetical protein
MQEKSRECQKRKTNSKVPKIYRKEIGNVGNMGKFESVKNFKKILGIIDFLAFFTHGIF